jgi:hypothetical protein
MIATQLTLRLEMDDEPLDWFPWLESLDVALVQGFRLAREGDAVYAPMAVEQVADPHILVVQSAGAVKLRVGTQTTSNIPIEPGGLFLLYNGALNTPDSECKAEAQTRITGWVGGD